MPETKYGKYIVTDLKTDFSEEFNAQYAKWATRILWIDDKVVEGAFQMNVSWYLKPQTGGFSEQYYCNYQKSLSRKYRSLDIVLGSGMALQW